MLKRNPYLNRSMVRSLDGFFGRQRELERTMARLGDATPQSVSIVGDRRIGKSSFLWHLAQPELAARYLDSPESYVFVYLDFQGQRHLDMDGFSRVFSGHLATAVGDRTKVAEAQDLTQLEAEVRKLTESGLRVIGLFDEFETVTGSDAFGAEFFGFLRSLANSYPIAYVTASRRELQTLCRSQEISESPFFNIFARIALGPIDGAAAAELIAAPSAAAGQPLDEHLDDIVDLGGHLPLFLQIACSAAFECLQETEAFDPALVQRRFRDEADAHLQYLWEHLDECEQPVVRRLLEGQPVGVDSATELARLEDRGCVRRVAGEPRAFSNALRALLVERGLLEPAEVAATPTPAEAAIAESSANTQVLRLEPVPVGRDPFPQIVGNSEELRRAFAFIERAAVSDVTVMLLGETGTGKELVSRTIHDAGPRKDGPFVVVNCGAIAEHLQESELFGHRKGAFTDAIEDKQGLFEAANGGTLLLDEIAEMAPATQVKLLRVLQEREVRRVGDTEAHAVDVRVIGATNRDLDVEVAEGRFREDLYYRLCVLVTRLPPLRDRREDIAPLATYFLKGRAISPQAMGVLAAHNWPGNVRELENQLSAACALAGTSQVQVEHLWPRLQRMQPAAVDVPMVESDASNGSAPVSAWDGLTLRQARDAFERDLLAGRLHSYDGDHAQVADSLSISRSRLYELIRKYGLRTD